jgi:hypothetical protein
MTAAAEAITARWGALGHANLSTTTISAQPTTSSDGRISRGLLERRGEERWRRG